MYITAVKRTESIQITGEILKEKQHSFCRDKEHAKTNTAKEVMGSKHKCNVKSVGSH